MTDKNEPPGPYGDTSDSAVTIYWQPDVGSTPTGHAGPRLPRSPRRRWAVVIVALVGLMSLAALGALGIFAIRALSGPPQIDSVRQHESNVPSNGVPPSVELPEATPVPPASPTQAPRRPRKPTGAVKACRDIYSLPDGPSYSAVNEHATCPFAENVRRAYVEEGVFEGTVTLYDVRSPVTKQYYVMVCRGQTVVTCRGGIDAVVYLYG